MGYESKLYVVNKHHWIWEDKPWGEVIAMFDLCKVSNLNFIRYPATDCYIYADNSYGTKITEDAYGEPLSEIPIKDAIQMLEDAIKKEKYYRRYKPCLDLLKGFNPDDWADLVVLHYGY